MPGWKVSGTCFQLALLAVITSLYVSTTPLLNLLCTVVIPSGAGGNWALASHSSAAQQIEIKNLSIFSRNRIFKAEIFQEAVFKELALATGVKVGWRLMC